jgi:hypothetical protein
LNDAWYAEGFGQMKQQIKFLGKWVSENLSLNAPGDKVHYAIYCFGTLPKLTMTEWCACLVSSMVSALLPLELNGDLQSPFPGAV